MIELNRAKQLRHGEIIHYYNNGKCQNWRVSGKVKLWKTRPNELKVPIKYGLYQNSYLTEKLLDIVHLESECPLCKKGTINRLTIAECIDLNINKTELARHYGLKNFDNAIPEMLFAELINGNDLTIYHFVFSYDRNKSFGELFPLTIEAENRMRELEINIPDMPNK